VFVYMVLGQSTAPDAYSCSGTGRLMNGRSQIIVEDLGLDCLVSQHV
jgi:hypothetical protein